MSKAKRTPRKPDLTQPQLFLDDTWIEDTSRIQRVWHEAKKYPEPVLTADCEWEYNCPVLYGTVLFHEGRFRMWYCAWSRKVPPRACYAESDDGVHWHKPKLGLHEVCGTKDNNVILQPTEEGGLIDDLTVIEDPEDEKWPLKMLFWDRHPFGIQLARSKDGIHWERAGLVMPDWGDRFNAVPQKVNGKYLLFGRAPGMFSHGYKGRVSWRTESSNLRSWSKPELVMQADHEDPPMREIYSITAFPYGELLMGSIERMHMSPDKLDTEIIWSHDEGRTWQRSRTRPSFIPWGQPGHFDDTWINLPASGPIEVDGRLFFHYSGRSGAHAVSYPHNHGAIGLATLRIDGFCSLMAAERPGVVETAPMTWPGGDLLLNLDCRRDIYSHPSNTITGDVRVEVRDKAGKPIKGFTFADTDGVRGNSFRSEYGTHKWGNRSLDKLRGRAIRLSIEMRDAHLYAFKAAGSKR